jgi:Ca2+-binding RTX toxin-like protein
VRGIATEHSPESDNVWNTAQSYNGPLGWIGGQSTMVATSMPDDIASLQSIYGARAFNSGANTYTFHRGDLYLSSSRQQLLDTRIVEARIANVNTLDDSGGMDIIDCSDVNSLFANEGVRIDMRPGGYVISKNDWDNPLTYTDNNGIQRGTLVTGVPQKGTRLSWRTTIEKCQGTESGSDTIIGNNINNWIAGYGGNDFLQGLDGADTLIGGDGSDQFFGGPGSDLIYLGGGDGGTDADRDCVDFSSANDSPASANKFDKIYGFGNNDVFDLNDIDGNTRSPGRQSLSFIGSRDFSGRAGELRLASASGAGTRGFIEADTNADRRADFRVALTGESTLATTLAADNFILTY